MPHSAPQEPPVSLAGLSAELARLTRAASPLVVAVHGRRRFPATGVVWRDGLIVTAAHGIRRQGEVAVALASGQETRASLLGIDTATDLAVLKTQAATSVPYEIEASAAMETGSLGLVISRRAGGHPAAALALVRASAGAWRTRGGATLERLVMLSVTPYPGLSGSPFIAATGAVAGVVTVALGPAGAVLVPAADVTRVVDQIVAKGRVAAPFLGIGTQPVRLPDRMLERLGLDRAEGVLIVGTQPDGPADVAGWMVGDVLVELANKRITDAEDLRSTLSAEQIGQSVAARIVRGGEIEARPIRVGERPSSRC